jgi:hypothetical protein
MLSQVLQIPIFIGKEHLVKKLLISTLDKEQFLRGLQNLTTQNRAEISWKNSPFCQTCFFYLAKLLRFLRFYLANVVQFATALHDFLKHWFQTQFRRSRDASEWKAAKERVAFRSRSSVRSRLSRASTRRPRPWRPTTSTSGASENSRRPTR